MRFEWDPKKNAINIRKHGIDFVDVQEMFQLPMLTALDERQEYGEDRWTGIGMLRSLVVVVVFTERRRDIVRIISARRATKYEEKKYFQKIQN